jgi:putative ABC transport system permease protein
VNLATVSLRNLWRNRLRTILTIVGVAVSILTFVALRTFVYAWTSAAEFAARDRVVTRHKVTFVMPLPKRYIEDVRNTPGIKTATWMSWFGGKDPKHENEFFGNFAVDKETFFNVYDEIQVDGQGLQKWKENRQGAIVGDVLAKKMGWKVGDKVTLDSGIYPADPDAPWSYTIEGIYTATRKSVDRSSFYFHWDYLNDGLPASRKDTIGWVCSRTTDPTRAAAIGKQLDGIFDAKDTQTLSQDEAAFNASFLAGFSAVLSVIDVVSFALLVIMMLVLGNTIAMGVRERTFEYGTLRAVGFLPFHIRFFVLAEAALIGALGGLVGMAMAYFFVEKGLGRFLEENMGQYFPYFSVPPKVWALAFGLAVGLALLAAIFPARGATRIPVTEALRRVV